jgi:uncharacterized protein YrrD
MREISTIVGLEVVGVADGKIVGRVTQVVYDLGTGRVEGLITGTGAGERGILVESILTIGADAVMVPTAEAAVRLSELPELMAKRREPEAPVLRAVTDDGQKLGQVSRVWIDPVARSVTRFEVSAGLLKNITDGPLMLPVVPGSTHGEDTLVVPAAALLEMSGHPGGLKAQVQHLSERVKEQSATARHSAEESAKTAREKIEKAVESARKQTVELAHKAREQTTELAQKAKEQTTELAHKAKEQTTELAHKAQAQARRAKPARAKAEPKPVPHREADEEEEPTCGTVNWDEPTPPPVEGPVIEEEGEKPKG